MNEVNIFLNNEYVTKESMKKLDQKVARRLNPKDVAADVGEVRKRSYPTHVHTHRVGREHVANQSL